jgi:acyl-CoA thioester hydrolase
MNKRPETIDQKPATFRRKKNGYFERVEGMPEPLSVSVERRVNFSEADVMGIAWHGRYLIFFEDASTELGRLCGLSYLDFYEANLRAPIVQLHIDFFHSLSLDEKFTVTASLIWNEGARLNTEYSISKNDGSIAATGYTVQMFTDGASGEVLIASPELLERCRKKWKAGDLKCPR